MLRCIVAILVLSATMAVAQELPRDLWAAWQPFLGTWEGAGGGGPGQGSGSFTFTPELQGAVLARHNYAQYPATKDKPAYRHDDLMVIYSDGKKTRADYSDNEGLLSSPVVCCCTPLAFAQRESRSEVVTDGGHHENPRLPEQSGVPAGLVLNERVRW